MLTIDNTRGNQATLRRLLYDGHGNLVRLMAPDYTLSGWQFRGVWGEVQGSLGTDRGYCANLGHPEDEAGLVYTSRCRDLLGNIFDMAFQFLDMPSFHRRQ